MTTFREYVEFKTLEDNRVKLTDKEREKVMKSKAVWHFTGKPSPAIKKSIIKGKTYYYSNTHRCFQSAETMEKAIKLYFDVVEPSS